LQRFSVEGMAGKNFHPWIRPRTGLESGSRRTIGERLRHRPDHPGSGRHGHRCVQPICCCPVGQRQIACSAMGLRSVQAGLRICCIDRYAAGKADRARRDWGLGPVARHGQAAGFAPVRRHLFPDGHCRPQPRRPGPSAGDAFTTTQQLPLAAPDRPDRMAARPTVQPRRIAADQPRQITRGDGGSRGPRGSLCGGCGAGWWW